jgi:hypothetical protein
MAEFFGKANRAVAGQSIALHLQTIPHSRVISGDMAVQAVIHSGCSHWVGRG